MKKATILVLLAAIAGLIIGQQIERTRSEAYTNSKLEVQRMYIEDNARQQLGDTIKRVCTHALLTKSAPTAEACGEAQERSQFEYMCESLEVSNTNCWVEDKKGSV